MTLRSFALCIVALFAMSIWIEYEQFNTNGGSLAGNAPPNSAVLVILILLFISVLLSRLRRSLRLTTAELLFIYAALLVAAPLMAQGMWHRLFALQAAIPHESDFKSYESLPDMLWPHGQNLIHNGRFTRGLAGFTFQGDGQLKWEKVEWRGKQWTSPVLDNGTNARARSTLSVSLNRWGARKHEMIVPGESWLLTLLLKAEGFRSTSAYYVKLQADSGPLRSLLLDNRSTPPSYALPSGLMRIGRSPVTIPTELDKTLTIYIGIDGPGKITIQDVQFFNSQAIEGAYMGRKVAGEKDWDKLPADARGFITEKPANMISPAGLRYLFTGFIPVDQWVRPVIAWSILIGALFLGYFGLNVLMRRQWVEVERNTFPMNILPRHLLANEEEVEEVAGDDADREKREGGLPPIFRNKIMWLGFAILVPLLLLKGLHFYFPDVPAPLWTDQQEATRWDSLVTDPLLKAYLQNIQPNLVFCLLAVALFIEKDILFSIWASFLLFQLMYLFGKAFNYYQIPGYPWESQQTMGAFIAYAVLAVIAGRRHLGRVFTHLFRRTSMDDAAEMVRYRTALLMVAGSLVLLAAWGIWTRMGILASLLFFGYVLICGFAAAKIRAEAAPAQGYWMPFYGIMFVGALGGFAVFGTTGMLVATLAGGFMLVSSFLFISPVQVEMMELGRQCHVRRRDIGLGLVLGLLGGIVIGGFTLLCWTYGFGADNLPVYSPYNQTGYFNAYRQGEWGADRAMDPATHILPVTPETAPLNFSANVDARGLGIGFVVTIILSLLRSLFTWFPLHPVGYVIATSQFARMTWFVCFLAWLIRSLVLRIGGTHAVRKGLIPFAIGMFLACLASIVLFDLVGIVLRLHGVTEIYSEWP